jgi:hypothetical protein
VSRSRRHHACEAALNILFFTRYTDYLGTFVMHCHILDHEPLKTMEVVDVVGEGPRSASMATRDPSSLGALGS